MHWGGSGLAVPSRLAEFDRGTVELRRGELLDGRNDGRGAMPQGDRAATEVGEDCSDGSNAAAYNFFATFVPSLVALAGFLFVH